MGMNTSIHWIKDTSLYALFPFSFAASWKGVDDLRYESAVDSMVDLLNPFEDGFTFGESGMVGILPVLSGIRLIEWLAADNESELCAFACRDSEIGEVISRASSYSNGEIWAIFDLTLPLNECTCDYRFNLPKGKVDIKAKYIDDGRNKAYLYSIDMV